MEMEKEVDKSTLLYRLREEKQIIIPFIVDERHKLYYYRRLKEFENERGYLMDTCLSAQDMYIELLKYFTEESNTPQQATGHDLTCHF